MLRMIRNKFFCGWSNKEVYQFLFSFLITMLFCAALIYVAMNIESIVRPRGYYDVQTNNLSLWQRMN